MNKQSISFKADEQKLTKTGGIEHYASNIVAYIEATFDLGTNWSGYDSVRAVWSNDYLTDISTVLDPNGKCIVPTEVLTDTGNVTVNLVGSIADGDTLTDRLTTYPCKAVVVDADAKVEGEETESITPSQFEQFVEIVHDEVEQVTGMTAEAETLPAGSDATASYSDGVLSFGIPRGDKGEQGEQGETGHTGEPAGFGDVTASVDNTVGTPSVVVHASGPDTAKEFDFEFHNLKGDKGDTGDTGATGNGIASTVLNPDYTLTITFTDGTSYTTPSIRGAKGDTGNTGATGNGIQSTVLNADYTLTITFTDGTSYTTPSIRGEQGPAGPVSDVTVNGTSVVDQNGVAVIKIPELVKTVQGNPIVIDDADGAVKALNVELTPIQEGTPWIDSDVYKEPYLFKACPQLSNDYNSELLDKIVGGTVAWNQLYNKTGNSTSAGITYTNTNGKITLSGEASANSWYTLDTSALPQNHKYLVCGGNPNSVYQSNAWLYFIPTVGTYIHLVGRKMASIQQGCLSVSIQSYTGYNANTNPLEFVPQIFDLTQMFGSTIADYIYSLEQATAGAGVAWFKKLFPKDYYAYNAGQLMSVKTSAHQMVGFNQLKTFKGYNNNSSPTFNLDNAVRVINGMSYEFNHGAVTNATSWRHAVACYDFNGNKIEKSGLLTVGDGGLGWNSSGGYYVNGTNGTRMSDTFTVNFNGYIIPFFLLGDTSASTTMADPCVHLRWDGERDGDYEAYKKWTYPLDSDLELRGIPKLDSANNLYYDGDTYESDGTATRKYGIITLDGTSGRKFTGVWGSQSSNPNAYVAFASIAALGDKTLNVISDKFVYSGASVDSMPLYSFVGGSGVPSTWSFALPKTVTSLAEANAWLESNPITILYPLATPTTEEADPYQNPQIVDDFGTEEYVDAGVTASTRDVAIPVGHESRYADIFPITGCDNTVITDNNGDDTTTTAITLPHTVYGADVDVTGGVSKETWQNIASYNGETISEPWLSSMDEYVQGATPTTGAQVCYELATPTDLSTTPTDLTLYNGDNVISSDGDMELSYVQDMAIVIRKIESQI